MIEGINASSLQFTNTSQIKVATNTTADATSDSTTATSTKTTTDSNENVSTSIQGDTVSISQKALKTYAAFSSNSVTNGGTGVSEETATDTTAAALASAANGIGITDYTTEKNAQQASATAVSASSGTSASSGSSSGTSSSTSTLSSYSESQLEQMLNDGDISQADYNAELARRQAEEASAQSSGDSQSLNVTDPDSSQSDQTIDETV